MNEKKYLKSVNKFAYASGDVACNIYGTFISSFVLVYLSNTIGLNPGICGTLILASKLLDGVTDILFGTLIDNTKSRMGKARPWILYTILPMAVGMVMLFAVPGTSRTIQYVYFFIVYTVTNAFFFTAANIAYSSLAVFMTKNKEEQVQLSVFRFIGAMLAGIIAAGATMSLVAAFGGGKNGWRIVAVIYAVIYVIMMLICLAGTKEIRSNTAQSEKNESKTNRNVFQNLSCLLRNPYYLILLVSSILYTTSMNMSTAVGSYFVVYALGDESAISLTYFTLTMMLPMIFGLVITPALVKRNGLKKSVLMGLCISMAGSVPFAISGISASPNLTVMLIGNGIRWFGIGPIGGTMAAFTAELSGYTLRRENVELEGTMFSCSSMGTKIGGGLGPGLAGWLLAAANYVSSDTGEYLAQPASALRMIKLSYTVIPVAITLIVLILYFFMNVESENKKWDEKHTINDDSM